MPTLTRITTLRWLSVVCAGVLSGATIRADTSPVEKALAIWQEGLQQVSTISSDFSQEKHLALFRNPLLIHGRLFLAENGAFAWETHRPMKHKLVVRDGRIRQWDEETRRVHTVSIRDNPVAATIHKQMSAWFSGQFSALADTYETSLASEHPVSLLFIPRTGTPEARYITMVQIWLRLDGQYLDKVKIEEKSGDTTLITFTNTVLNLALPDSTWNVESLSTNLDVSPANKPAE